MSTAKATFSPMSALEVPRTIFDGDGTYGLFRESVRTFLEREVLPYHAEWEEKGLVPREVWTKAGAAGFLCCDLSEEYGGPGGTFLHSTIVMEELLKAGATGLAFAVHSDVVVPYLVAFGSEEQKRTLLPQMAAGAKLMAVAMTEPSGGSDLAALTTVARRDGDEFVVSGQKVFITNAQHADVFVAAVKTDLEAKRGRGISLLLVERERAGLTVGAPVKKLGYRASDTSEVFFDEVRVPVENLLGEEGQGFAHMIAELARERLTQGIRATAMAGAAVELTMAHAKDRNMFGRTLADFQNTQFVLAQCHSEVQLNQVFVDRCIELLLADELSSEVAAICKLESTEMLGRVADRCLQLFGGWGYMWEYPIARLFADARMARIAGGSVETMKHLIGRSLLR